MENMDLLEVVKDCIKKGRPVSWIRDNCPGIWSAYGFDLVYSCYQMERARAMRAGGVSVNCFLY